MATSFGLYFRTYACPSRLNSKTYSGPLQCQARFIDQAENNRPFSIHSNPPNREERSPFGPCSGLFGGPFLNLSGEVLQNPENPLWLRPCMQQVHAIWGDGGGSIY